MDLHAFPSAKRASPVSYLHSFSPMLEDMNRCFCKGPSDLFHPSLLSLGNSLEPVPWPQIILYDAVRWRALRGWPFFGFHTSFLFVLSAQSCSLTVFRCLNGPQDLLLRCPRYYPFPFSSTFLILFKWSVARYLNGYLASKRPVHSEIILQRWLNLLMYGAGVSPWTHFVSAPQWMALHAQTLSCLFGWSLWYFKYSRPFCY